MQIYLCLPSDFSTRLSAPPYRAGRNPSSQLSGWHTSIPEYCQSNFSFPLEETGSKSGQHTISIECFGVGTKPNLCGIRVPLFVLYVACRAGRRTCTVQKQVLVWMSALLSSKNNQAQSYIVPHWEVRESPGGEDSRPFSFPLGVTQQQEAYSVKHVQNNFMKEKPHFMTNSKLT